MSNELIKETIVLNQNIGKETTQVLLEGDIIVPDIKPDMSVMLKTDADVCFNKTEASSDRVNFSGKINLRVLYLAKGSEKPVHSMISSAAFDDFINMEGVNRDMWVEVCGNIANIDYKMLNDRKISYRCVVDITIYAETKVSHDIVTHISDLPEAQLQKRPLTLSKTVENKEDRFIVKDELPISPGKPNIRELLQTTISIANKDVKIGTGRVQVNGELIVSTLYKGDDDSVIEFIEHELPFNGTIDAPMAKDGMYGDVTLSVQDHYTQIRKDSDGEDRIIDIEASIGALVKVTSQTEMIILDDAYAINQNIELKNEIVNYPRLVCRNKNQCPVKEIVHLDPVCPDILQIFRVTGTVHVDDMKVVEDKVVVEGIINTDVLYIANNDDAPLYNFNTVLPYKQVIETKGAAPSMECAIEHGIDHIGFNMLSDREMELRFLISFNTRVTEQKKSKVIIDIIFTEMDKSVLDCMPSMTIYVVQKDDTLWSIAKRFNSSIEELIDINEIENPSKIYPGQKLLILKKVLY